MDTPRPRKPFVNTIVEEVAAGFVMGGVLGSAYRFAKDGCFRTVCKSMPRMSCSTALWFGASAAIDYAIVSARGKEEPVLDCAVAAGGACGITSLAKGKGLRYAGKSALVGTALGGVLLGGARTQLEGRRRRRVDSS